MIGFKLIILILLTQLTNFVISNQSLIKAIDNFSKNFFFYSQIENTSTNLQNGQIDNHAFSPFSISQLFSMIISGSKDETQRQLMDTLGYKNQSILTVKQVDDAFKLLTDEYDREKIIKSKREIEFNMASIALYADGFKIEDQFESNLKINYKAEFRKINFDKSTSLDEINEILKHKTNGLIPKLFDQLSPDALLVLANAFYFKGKWKNKFKLLKEPKMFKNADGKINEITMMYLDGYLNYKENEHGQYVEIPYTGNLTMSIILPQRNASTNSLVQKIDYKDKFGPRIKNNQNLEHVKLYLPKFKIFKSIDLKEILMSMGIKNLFNDKLANLTGISKKPLYVLQAKHETYLEVNEKGTKAVASTSAEFAPRTSVLENELNYKSMVIERPFFFDIYDDLNDLHLFSGVIKKL